MQRFGDTPHSEHMSETDKSKIMHIRFKGENSVELMGSDHLDFGWRQFIVGNNVSLSVHPKSEEMARQIFDKLADGGTVTMPIGKVFWGAYFGMLTDKFGINWLINHEYK